MILFLKRKWMTRVQTLFLWCTEMLHSSSIPPQRSSIKGDFINYLSDLDKSNSNIVTGIKKNYNYHEQKGNLHNEAYKTLL